MTLTINTPPQSEPVTLDEAKDHLRVDGSDQDSLLTGLITASRKWIEDYLGRALITQTWDYWLDDFPYGDKEIRLPKAPLQSVSAITYTDADGVEQTWGSSKYVADSDSDPGRVYLAYNEDWPSHREQRKVVKIRFVAGYGDDSEDIPRPIIEAMLLQLQTFYEQPINFDKRAIESALESLLSMYRVIRL